MADCKLVEIRDRLTFIPALAIRLRPRDEEERYLISRAGFGCAPSGQRRYVVLVRLTDSTSKSDPHAWRDRTMATAHAFVAERFETLPSGAVIDVEFILGETAEPKCSESESVRLVEYVTRGG